MVIGVTLRHSGSAMPTGYWSFSMVGAMATFIGSLAAASPLIFMATMGCSHRGVGLQQCYSEIILHVSSILEHHNNTYHHSSQWVFMVSQAKSYFK